MVAEKDLSRGTHLERSAPKHTRTDPHPRSIAPENLVMPSTSSVSFTSSTTLDVEHLPSINGMKDCDSHVSENATGGIDDHGVKGGNDEKQDGDMPVQPLSLRKTDSRAAQLGATGGSALPAPCEPPSENGETTYPEGGLRAWLVVLGAFSGMVASFGIMNTVGTLQAYISTHQLANFEPELIGWIFSIYIFVAFFGGLQIGPIFDAKGPRWLIAAGSVFLVGGTLALAESTEYWHFLLSFSLCCGLGTSLLFTPAVSAVAHFFSRRRGTATGIATTGGSLGGVIFPLMLESLFGRLGWAWSIRIMALIFIVLVLVANLLIRSRLPPKRGGSVWPDLRIFRQRAFAVTTAGVFFMEWGLFVPLTYLSSWAAAAGVGGSPAFAFQLLAVLNAASFFGRWLPGYVADRWGRFLTMVAALALCLVFVLAFWLPAALTHSPVHGSTALAVLFAIGFGFGSGSNISLTPVCVGQLCATDEYGRYYATCYTLVSVGCLTGVPIAGALLTRAGGAYGPLIAFVAASYALSTACFTYVKVHATGWSLKAIY